MTETLTPQTFDAIAARRSRIIWTLGGIAQCLGRGPDFVRTLVDQPGSPIHRQGRRFYAFEDELMAWMHAGR